jgi:hypothetical protein
MRKRRRTKGLSLTASPPRRLRPQTDELCFSIKGERFALAAIDSGHGASISFS